MELGAHGVHNMRQELSKSQIVKRVARKRGIRFVEVPLSMLEAKDLRGFPQVRDPQSKPEDQQ